MSERKVILVSENALLREGLKKILGEIPNIDFQGVASNLDEGISLAKRISPDVILVDQATKNRAFQQKLSEFLDLAEVRVISMTMGNRDLMIYQRTRVPEASLQDLLVVLSESDRQDWRP